MTAPVFVEGDPGDRGGRLGATSIAALICAHEGVPYFSGTGAWSVWLDVMHPELSLPVPAERQARFALGHHLEPLILARAAEDKAPEGIRIQPAGGYLIAPGHEWFRAQVDALAWYDHELIGVCDAKATERPWEYTEWTHESGDWERQEVYPRGYEVQLRVQLALLRLHGHLAEVGILAVLDRTSAPWVPDGDGVRVDLAAARMIYRDVLYDPADVAYITDYVFGWWQRHVVEGVEPDNDSSEACERWRLHEARKLTGQAEADPRLEALAREWMAGKAEAKRLAEQDKELKNRLLAMMPAAKVTMGRQYVQVQSGPRDSLVLKGYRF